MRQPSRIFAIDQDTLLQASGLITMRPSDSIAIIVEPSHEDSTRDFFLANWGIELRRGVLNDIVERRVGLRALSIDTSLFASIEAEPAVTVVGSLEELPSAMFRGGILSPLTAAKDEGKER